MKISPAIKWRGANEIHSFAIFNTFLNHKEQKRTQYDTGLDGVLGPRSFACGHVDFTLSITVWSRCLLNHTVSYKPPEVPLYFPDNSDFKIFNQKPVLVLEETFKQALCSDHVIRCLCSKQIRGLSLQSGGHILGSSCK